MAHEKEVGGLSGWLVVFVMLLVGAGAVWVMATLQSSGDGFDWIIAAGVLALVLDGVSIAGFTVVNPNEAFVVTLFGVYKGTIKRAGFWWVNPLTTRRKLSLRVRNFESAKLKVNERDGNPIEIAAVVVWRIVETFEAVFNVDDYEHFMHVQTEAAVRNLATSYPYDSHEDGNMSLRLSAGGEVADRHAPRNPGSAVESGHRGHRSADQPPRVRARDRGRDAAASAGLGRHCRARRKSSRAPWAWSRWRSTSSAGRTSSRSTKSARRRW